MRKDGDGAEGAAALERIAAALERLAPPPERLARTPLGTRESRLLWLGSERRFAPAVSSPLPLGVFRGVDAQRERLWDNTMHFARGLAAHDVLLWGARGMGKSSLVKAVHEDVVRKRGGDAEDVPPLTLVGLAQEDLGDLAILLRRLAEDSPRRFLLFADDLTFGADDSTYRALKSVLEGGVSDRPDNCLVYATSNRRHLMPREAVENERTAALRPEEVVEDKVSLADRFGLSLGFHPMSEETCVRVALAYMGYFGLDGGGNSYDESAVRAEARQFARERGNCSGRVAWQFVRDWAARRGLPLRPKAG